MLGVNGTLKMCLGFSVGGSAVRLLQSKDTRSLRYGILFPPPISSCAPIVRARLLWPAWVRGCVGVGGFCLARVGGTEYSFFRGEEYQQ